MVYLGEGIKPRTSFALEIIIYLVTYCDTTIAFFTRSNIAAPIFDILVKSLYVTSDAISAYFLCVPTCLGLSCRATLIYCVSQSGVISVIVDIQ